MYPDIKAGIVGTWRDGVMVTGKPAILNNFISLEGMGSWVEYELVFFSSYFNIAFLLFVAPAGEEGGL